MDLGKLFKKLFMDDKVESVVDFLLGVPVFEGLSKRALRELINIAYFKTFSPGEVVFEEGRIGKAFYIIKKGKVEVSKDGKALADLGPGEFFGEMAILDEVPRTATARAAEESMVILIYKIKMDILIESNPSTGVKILKNVARILSTRLRQANINYISVKQDLHG